MNFLKILVVEDEDDILELLEEIFTIYGHTVVTAKSGISAVKILQKDQQFDLVLSDYRMPNGNGMKVLKHVAQMPVRPLFIFLSGEPEMSVEDCLKAGADKFFFKPIDLDHLVGSVEKLSKKRKQLPIA